MEILADHWLPAGAAIATLCAALAWLGDRRRLRRRDLDRVGIMPWTSLFFWSLLAAVLMLAAAVQSGMAQR